MTDMLEDLQTRRIKCDRLNAEKLCKLFLRKRIYFDCRHKISINAYVFTFSKYITDNEIIKSTKSVKFERL